MNKGKKHKKLSGFIRTVLIVILTGTGVIAMKNHEKNI